MGREREVPGCGDCCVERFCWTDTKKPRLVTLTDCSFFERTRLDLETYFGLVTTLLHLKPPRQRYISLEFGVSSNCVVDWYSFCREVYFHHISTTSKKIGGPLTVVEIDEAKFGKRKYNRGRNIQGQWVFGGIERQSRESFLVPVDQRDRDTLLDIIQQWVLPGTTIVSDCWRAYNCLGDEGFRHLTVNHSINFVDPNTGAHTNTIERHWREVRANIPRYGVRTDHFVGYLAEFLFKTKYRVNALLGAI
ncbi:uncharacterized protein LOC124355897 [Homalodisca vitripennis]|uniref:uncharacterized protein LOC124355897 n=1 Tax=Homalodisca vitripennis TaxID=197043 RepID=UPI001EECB3AC|nr:uncharacterized protein LOC124355897 [Homalodisca vitripennis]